MWGGVGWGLVCVWDFVHFSNNLFYNNLYYFYNTNNIGGKEANSEVVFNHLPFLFLQSSWTQGLSEGIWPCWTLWVWLERPKGLILHLSPSRGLQVGTSLLLTPLATCSDRYSVLWLSCTWHTAVLCGHLQCSFYVTRLWYLSQRRKWWSS